MSRRIAYVLKRYPRYSETFVVNEILAQEALGAEIEIFSLRHPEDGHFQDAISRVRAPVRYLPATGLRAADFWAALEEAAAVVPTLWREFDAAKGLDHRHVVQAMTIARACRERHIGHLHAHFATEATSVAALAARWAEIPFSFTAHAKDIFHDETDLTALAAKMKSAASVITVSDFNAAFLRRLEPIAAERIVRIYNGLDLDLFRFHADQSRARRIVAVGRLVPKKGFEVLVHACAILRRRGVAFECRIIGSGELEEALRQRIGALGLNGHVWLCGPSPQEALRAEISASAALAAPCVTAEDGNRDGLPTVLVEAMALGTPCVSSPVTGIPEVVRHDETGLLVPERDPDKLADALERLLGDVSLRQSLAKRARALIEEHFDAGKNAVAIWGVQQNEKCLQASGVAS